MLSSLHYQMAARFIVRGRVNMRRASPPQRGFTLLELLVVMGIVVLLFLFTLPNLDSFTLTDPPKKVAALIATTCKDLKIRARKEKKRFRLDVLSDTGEIWVTHEDMDEKERAQAREGGFTLPEEMSVACLSNSLVVDKETGAKGIFFILRDTAIQQTLRCAMVNGFFW